MEGCTKKGLEGIFEGGGEVNILTLNYNKVKKGVRHRRLKLGTMIPCTSYGCTTEGFLQKKL